MRPFATCLSLACWLEAPCNEKALFVNQKACRSAAVFRQIIPKNHFAHPARPVNPGGLFIHPPNSG
jgi:hypothetical protein